MTRSETLCAIVLVLAVPGAALAGLYPGALQGIGGGDDRAAVFTTVAAKNAMPAPPVAPKPQVSAPKLPAPVAPVGTQVSGTGMVRTTTGPTSAIGGANHVLPGQIGGASFRPKY